MALSGCLVVVELCYLWLVQPVAQESMRYTVSRFLRRYTLIDMPRAPEAASNLDHLDIKRIRKHFPGSWNVECAPYNPYPYPISRANSIINQQIHMFLLFLCF